MVHEIEEQHPIPQDISSYQFRLVGDMTLKQFLQVAAGALFALFLYASPLHPFIKWSLIMFSVLMGIALAFMPIEDRPLGTWIIAFFRSIYSPTIFVWKKSDKPLNYFQPEAKMTPAPVATAPQKKVQPPIPVPEKTEGVIFRSEQESKALSNLEKREQNFLSRVAHLFTLPSLSVKQKARSGASGTTKIKLPEPITVTFTSDKEEKQQPKTQTPAQTKTPLPTFKVDPAFSQKRTFAGSTLSQLQAIGEPPAIPAIPNVIVGQVLDPEESIIEGAILEIKDEQGRPVRALKSNKLGHFMIVTPLLNGKYEIITEKEGFVFEPTTFQAEGKIISPLSIKAKKKISMSNTN